MRAVMIGVVTLSLASAAFAADPLLFRGRFAPNYNAAPAPGSVEASTTFDVPAAAPNAAAPLQAAPAPVAAEYGHDHGYAANGGDQGYGANGGCSTCNGNKGGYFNFSWFGGCCEQQKSCCSNIWDGFCGQRKQWCNHGCKTGHCQQAPCQQARCQPAPTCSTCKTGCGHHHAWMNGSSLFAGYRPIWNWGNSGNQGCSSCGEGSVVYGKHVEGGIDSEAPGIPAPAAEPLPAPRLEPTPARPAAREAARPFFPGFRLMPTNYGS